MTDEPEPVMEVELKDAEAPDGKPLTLRLTVPLNPPLAAIPTLYVVPEP
jgi:hypothetical protein